MGGGGGDIPQPGYGPGPEQVPAHMSVYVHVLRFRAQGLGFS